MLQNDLSAKVYKNLMIDNLEGLSCLRLRALENIEANKLRVAKYYNKKVKIKQFSKGDLVRKLKLPIVGQRTVNSANGHLTGKDLIGSSVVRLVILIFWKH